MTSTEIFWRALERRSKWVVHQFGQLNDSRTNNGSTGCTDTCIQAINWFWKGTKLTHNQIRALAGNTDPSRGLYYSQVQTVMRRLGLPYVVELRLNADEMLEAAKKGPVIFGESYSWHPEWYGYRYGRILADGKPNGYASTRGKAGKTQLSGFVGAHAGVLLGSRVVSGRIIPYVIEPNHGSPARPEKPAYDSMSLDQWRKVIESYKGLGRDTYAVIPTKAYNG